MKERPHFSLLTEYEELSSVPDEEGQVLMVKTVGIKDEKGGDRLKIQYMGGEDSTVDDIYINATWIPKVSKQDFFAKAEGFVRTLEKMGIKGDETVPWNYTVPQDEILSQPTKSGLLFEADTLDTPYGSFSYHGDQVDFETFQKIHVPEPMTEFIAQTMKEPIQKGIIKKQLEKSPFREKKIIVSPPVKN